MTDEAGRIRSEMLATREAHRETHPVAPLGQGQSPSDHRDQQHTAAWNEARILLSGREGDPTSMRIASELAVEGRPGIDDPSQASDLAQALAVMNPARAARAATVEPGITYEGIDLSERDPDWRRSLHMPGDRLRFDSDAKVSGIDPHDTMAAIGVDPLTVSKAVVRGVSVPDGMGGERQAAFLEYEFEGREGRHNAKQFMEEGGRDHMYGVVLVRDERMWSVPIHIENDGSNPVIDGTAKEIVGFAGRDQDELDPDGVDGMRKYVAEQGPISGEFYTQPRDGYRAPGPVNLLNAPWTSGVDPAELAIAEKAVDLAIDRETRLKEDPVRFHIGEMQAASDAFRVQRPVRDDQTTTAATHEAMVEANYLMRGRDVSDGSVRMAAAMLATEGRTAEGVGIASRGIADAMAPSHQRKELTAQAAASLSSARVSSKGPASESAMPPFGATMVRKGAER